MRTVRIEYLRPAEIQAERARCSIAYLSMGPLEWHGPAMPYGTDALAAHAVACAAAQVTGGVVMPPLYLGTERERPAFMLEAKGFENPESMYVKGMDVPANCMPSYYAREDIFGVMVREHLRLLVEQGYELIVLFNGHGAFGQRDTLTRLAVEFSNETPSRVVYSMIDINGPDFEPDFGHGCLIEASLLRYLHDGCMDLGTYPPREVPLKYTDYGIADECVFAGRRSTGDAVVNDPRDATPELGRQCFDNAVNNLVRAVQAAYDGLK